MRDSRFFLHRPICGMRRAIFGIFVVLLGGCVSGRKYREVLAERDYFKAEYQALSEIEQEKLACQRELRALRAELKEAVHDLEVVMVQAASLERDNARLQEAYEQLLQQNEALLSTASYEKQSLEARLAAKIEELDEKEAQLRALEYVLDQRRQELEALERTLRLRGVQADRVGQWLAARDAELGSVYSGLQVRLNAWTGQPVTWMRESGDPVAPLIIRAPRSFFVGRGNRLSSAVSNLLNDLRGLTLPFPLLAVEVRVPVGAETFEKDASLLVALAARLYELGYETDQILLAPAVQATPPASSEVVIRVVPRWQALATFLAVGDGEPGE